MTRAATPESADAVTIGTGVVDDDPAAAVGTVLGRYVVIERVGEGGMGTVLRAYDTKLYRNVALKLLRVGNDAEARTRIVAEAQAMARLSHPNIVAVYDVGEHDDAPFIAMEFVEGVDLRQWIEREQRSWDAIVGAFIEAGRGLAAAHRAGLVHRDFKPDNLLLGDDERVRVTDFGLARGLDDGERGGRSSSRTGPTLTVAGTVMGTLAYMAPEQHSGERVDERSDQYAYCVSLWEALYGKRPFDGDGLVAAKTLLQITNAPSAEAVRRVPRFLRSVMLRGLAPEPAERWPSMDALLVALAQRPSRRWFHALAGVLVLVGAGAWWGQDRWQRAADREACEEQAASIETLWSEEARARLHRQFATVEASFALPTFDRLVPWLDRFASSWQEHSLAECLAARGLTAPAPSSGSAECLEERRAQFSALLDVLHEADAVVVRKSITSASALPSPATCVDAAWLARWTPDPMGPETAEVRARFAELESKITGNRFEEATALAPDVVAAAEALANAPGGERLVVRAHVLAGRVAQDRGDYDTARAELELAFASATQAGADGHALESANMLAYIVGDAKAHHDAGLVWGQVAWAIARRIGAEEDPVAADLHNTIGGIHQNAGRHEEALTAYREALAITERTLGLEHPLAGRTQTNIATTLQELGRYEESLAQFRVAIATYERVLGPDNPEISVTINNYGNALNSAGRGEEALQAYERATSLYERAGVADVRLAPMLFNTGNVHLHAGHVDEAIDYYERALANWKTALGEQHPYVAMGLGALASTYGERGDYDRAIEYGERALAIRRAVYGEEHADIANSLNNLGSTYSMRGDWDRGEQMCVQARDMWARTLGPAHPDRAMAIINIGQVQLWRGDVDAAQATTEEAVELLVAALGEKHDSSALAFQNLGDVLLARGDFEGARVQYEKAQRVLEEVGFDESGSRVASLWSGIGKVRLESGDIDGAAEAFEHGRKAASVLPEPAAIRAELDFGLARTSWEQGQERLALEFAHRAREAFTHLDRPHTARAALDQWLAERE